MTPRCPYCKDTALLVTGKKVYPKEEHKALWKKNFWVCPDCDSRVGCHKDSTKPLGRLANRELRKARTDAHNAFDPLWKEKKMSRKKAYGWLSKKLKVPLEKCHIGMFGLDKCKEVINVCAKEKEEDSLGSNKKG